MKATGVVRRIDDLGRIVIPKELRRSLHIRDGESLEIFVDDEMIALKKFSSMDDIAELSDNLVNTISQNISKNIIITDRDKVISTSNNARKYLNNNISKCIEENLSGREIIKENSFIEVELIDGLEEKLSYVISPVIANGDVIGSVIIFSNSSCITEIDIKLASITSSFLGKRIEE